MAQRDGMGREVGEGFTMGNTFAPVVDSCWCMAKPIQYCKVISLQLNKLKKKKNLHGTKDFSLCGMVLYPNTENCTWRVIGLCNYMPKGCEG